ncbi:MAG: hypothetical protein HQM00_10570 [Magnetococcales bacterium]|nr:hypothetical protein [Magnetococcales bacterium]
MDKHARQRGAFVVLAMIVLAGVAAMGGSLAKMQVSGVDVAAEFSSGNKAFNMAETAIQVGLKQFKDAECDPSALVGAEAEGVDGSTVVTQSLGEMGGFKLTFCPMDATCYPASLIPDDADVSQAETEVDDETPNHSYWHHKHGRHWGWLAWISHKNHYRFHHWRHNDKREHWRSVRDHMKMCHGPRHRHHNNHDPKCETGGSVGVEDSINYWMVAAVDSSTGKQRTLKQVVSCESGPENVGNLFTGDNRAAWSPSSMINQATGMVTFGTSNSTQSIEASDGSELSLPDDEGQDVWFHGTFKTPADAGDYLSFEFQVKKEGYRRYGGTRTIRCGEKKNHGSGVNNIDLTKSSTTIRCDRSGGGYYDYDIKCDGSVDAECNISAGKLHFNLGRFDTAKIKKIEVDGRSTELRDAYLGNKDGGVEATAKPDLKMGQWFEDL